MRCRQGSCDCCEKLTGPANCAANGLVKCNWAGKAGKVRLWDLWQGNGDTGDPVQQCCGWASGRSWQRSWHCAAARVGM